MFLDKIFSAKNKDNHKVITIFGFRLKFLRKTKILLDEIKNMNGILLSLKDELKNIPVSSINSELKKINTFNEKMFISQEKALVTIKEELSNLSQQTLRIIEGELKHLPKQNAVSIKDELYGVVNGVNFLPRNTFLQEAHEQTINFIKGNMDLNTLIMKPDRISNLKYALSLIKIDGLMLEFGVFSGETINIAANYFKEKIFDGFDSFEGLPEDWNGWTLEKTFFKTSQIPQVRENVRLHKGWFNEVLPKFLGEHKEDVSFLHVDCDIYSSAKYVLFALKDRVKAGTIIVFDEFFNYPNWQNHEYKAFKEFINETGFKYEYVSIGRDQVTVRIIG
ncbi:MAG: class I SAM-dependent methyltransferase [Cyanobacteriota bacterium]|nr:class I SAM-dependent methyltransferase [Cyanobacteriota bacterium]